MRALIVVVAMGGCWAIPGTEERKHVDGPPALGYVDAGHRVPIDADPAVCGPAPQPIQWVVSVDRTTATMTAEQWYAHSAWEGAMSAWAACMSGS